MLLSTHDFACKSFDGFFKYLQMDTIGSSPYEAFTEISGYDSDEAFVAYAASICNEKFRYLM